MMRTSPEEILTGFARVLRQAGLPVTMADTQTFIEAVAHLDLSRPHDVYWAGRATLCTQQTHIPTYDYAFRAWFSTESTPAVQPAPPPITTGYEAGLEAGDHGEAMPAPALASRVELLRHRDIASLSPGEQRLIAQQFQTLYVPNPRRTTRRLRAANHGVVDRVRTVRDQRRRAGEPGPLRYARRTTVARRIIFFIDVSGSMKPYADANLRLAHHVATHTCDTEVFAVGTRLTRITSALVQDNAETALAAAGDLIPDWAGGTRLADNLRDFLATWGRRGMARGACVVLASDGWERGNVNHLGEQVRQLRAVAKRVIWSNPHAGKSGYEPIQGGIAAALPHVDGLVAGHSLAALNNTLHAIDGTYKEDQDA